MMDRWVIQQQDTRQFNTQSAIRPLPSGLSHPASTIPHQPALTCWSCAPQLCRPSWTPPQLDLMRTSSSKVSCRCMAAAQAGWINRTHDPAFPTTVELAGVVQNLQSSAQRQNITLSLSRGLDAGVHCAHSYWRI